MANKKNPSNKNLKPTKNSAKNSASKSSVSSNNAKKTTKKSQTAKKSEVAVDGLMVASSSNKTATGPKTKRIDSLTKAKSSPKSSTRKPVKKPSEKTAEESVSDFSSLTRPSEIPEEIISAFVSSEEEKSKQTAQKQKNDSVKNSSSKMQTTDGINNGESKNKAKFHRVLAAIFSIFEFLSASALIVHLYRSNMLSNKILLIATIIIIALWLLTGLPLLFGFKTRKKTTKKGKTKNSRASALKITCAILTLVLGSVYIYASTYLSDIISAVATITTGVNYETQEYSVIVMNSSNKSTIYDLASETIGFQTAVTHADLAEETLSRTISFRTADYADMIAMLTDLDSGAISAAAFPTTYLDILKDSENEIYDDLKVIYTFDIAFPKESTTSNIDVTTDPFILYITGSDARGPITEVSRSDVNMLVVVNPTTHKILLVSVPRDYYVQLHGTTGTKDKLTHAGVYGVEMSKNTMEDLFGLEINYTVKVGFDVVRELVDEIDGIDITSDATFTCWTDRSCYFYEGTQHVYGDCALAFARERKSYSTGDVHRVQNQQQVLTAIFNKMLQTEYLLRANNILSSVSDLFVTDMSYDDISSLIRLELTTLASWDIESYNVDGTADYQPTYTMGSQLLYVSWPDYDTITTANEKINLILEGE